MACCQHLVLMLVLATNLTSGSVLLRHLNKREATSPQVVQVSAPSYTDNHQQPSSLESSLGLEKSHSFKSVKHPSEAPISSQARPKEMLKSSESLRKKTQGTGRRSTKRGKASNKDLLHHLGMVKLRSPAVNHHRKRLASQSRKTHGHKNIGDSKMFVIKLPPNPYYYAHHDLPPRPEVNSLPVDFSSNGKPSRIYHWNIPVLKKMVARKAGSSGKSAVFADSDIFNIDKQATWNDTDDDKSTYRKASFYAPKKQSKHPFRKYFAGNGKPHSFYVMDKSSYKKPVSVHRLLP